MQVKLWGGPDPPANGGHGARLAELWAQPANVTAHRDFERLRPRHTSWLCSPHSGVATVIFNIFLHAGAIPGHVTLRDRSTPHISWGLCSVSHSVKPR